MAERRMIAKTIVDSDAFLDMPASSQLLYFHLNVRADDEGFLDNPKKIMRMTGGNADDLKVLLAKRYLLSFESGVIVVKHWKLHNCIRKDRMKETLYVEEKSQLIEKENGSYTEAKSIQDKDVPICQPDDNQVSTKRPHSIGKVSIGKESKGLSPVETVKEISSMKDALADHYQKLFLSVQPVSSWGNVGTERATLNGIAKKTDLLFRESQSHKDKYSLAEAVFSTFLEMRQYNHWKAKGKPVIPTALITCWSDIVTTLAEGYQEIPATYEEVLF